MTLIDYIDHFVITFIHELNPTYYAGIMLNAFDNLLCLTLCWHNRPGPTWKEKSIYFNRTVSMVIVAVIFTCKELYS